MAEEPEEYRDIVFLADGLPLWSSEANRMLPRNFFPYNTFDTIDVDWGPAMNGSRATLYLGRLGGGLLYAMANNSSAVSCRSKGRPICSSTVSRRMTTGRRIATRLRMTPRLGVAARRGPYR